MNQIILAFETGEVDLAKQCTHCKRHLHLVRDFKAKGDGTFLSRCSTWCQSPPKVSPRYINSLQQSFLPDLTSEKFNQDFYFNSPDTYARRMDIFNQPYRVDVTDVRSLEDLCASMSMKRFLEEKKKEELHQAVRQLSTEQREVIEMFFFEEIPPKTIAKRLKLTIAKILKLKNAALEALRLLEVA